MLTNEQLKKELDRDQYVAVTAPLQNMLCIANAGSGKTRVLTYRIAKIISDGQPEDSVLMVTFTRKAANEMMGRIKKLLGKEEIEIMGGTFHSIGVRFMKQFPKVHGLGAGFSILDESDSVAVMKNVFKDVYPDKKNEPSIAPKDLYSYYSFARNTLNDVIDIILEQNPSLESWLPTLELVVKKYEVEKKLMHAIDFDDILIIFDKMLDNPAFRSLINTQYKNIFVDEYQDINALQDSIIRKLSDGAYIMAVGDEAQCIYGWRGSDISFIQDFPKTYKNVGVFKIRNNYRSSGAIVGLALDVINGGVTDEKEKKEMFATQSFGKPVKIAYRSDPDSQARLICDEVEKGAKQGIPFSEIAIFVRTRKQANEIELEMNRRRLPVSMECGLPFFSQKHIKPAVSFLQILTNPKDVLALKRVFKMVPKVGDKSIVEISQTLKDVAYDVQSFVFALKPKGDKVIFQQLSQLLLRAAKKVKSASVEEILTPFIDEILLPWLKREDDPDYKDRRDDVYFLKDMLGEFTSVDDFLENAALNTDKKEAKANSVRLMTIHKAKGLEWDKVIFSYVCEPVIPTNPSSKEDRRLFYVAITRAKKELVMTAPAKFIGFGGVQPASECSYLACIPHAYLIKENSLSDFSSYRSWRRW